MSHDYHTMLFRLDDPKLADVRGMTAREFGAFNKAHPFIGPAIESWVGLTDSPFTGLTCDGNCESGLFPLANEGAPAQAMTAAARRLFEVLSPEQAARVRYSVEAREWRFWFNPEFLLKDNGLRLEDLAHETRVAILAVIKASLSAKGYQKARDCMRVNAFLGQLTDLPLLMNEWSYNFSVFGEPSNTAPWGWQLYGHHLALNCFVQGGQMVISPTFMGAEPNLIDAGPNAGVRLFQDEEHIGLSLMQSLPRELQDRAVSYSGVRDPKIPPGRLHPGDQFHLGGAFQDNRVVPYEGVCAADFTGAQKDALLQAAAAFLAYLPEEPLRHRIAQIERHLDRTWWSWNGGHGDDDPFYYRIQSPVVMMEFDHHWGVWLNNTEPAKCHTHTVVRTPNGNDYGRDLLRQHFAEAHVPKPTEKPSDDAA